MLKIGPINHVRLWPQKTNQLQNQNVLASNLRDEKLKSILFPNAIDDGVILFDAEKRFKCLTLCR